MVGMALSAMGGSHGSYTGLRSGSIPLGRASATLMAVARRSVLRGWGQGKGREVAAARCGSGQSGLVVTSGRAGDAVGGGDQPRPGGEDVRYERPGVARVEPMQAEDDDVEVTVSTHIGWFRH